MLKVLEFSSTRFIYHHCFYVTCYVKSIIILSAAIHVVIQQLPFILSKKAKISFPFAVHSFHGSNYSTLRLSARF